MLILTKKLIIILFVFIVNLFTYSYCQDYRQLFENACDDNANFTINSRYQRNLDNALSSLTSDTSIRYGFYNRSVGQSPDQANAYGLCRGDIEPNDCRRCINEAITTLREICPNQKRAIGWYDECMLRYSNVTILGNSDESLSRGVPNPDNVSNPSEFNQGLDRLLDQLRSDASRGGSLRKYAANTTNGPGFLTIYAYMQCTPNLLENQCYRCLENAMKLIPGCCDGRRGGRVYFPSCNLRYEVYRFLNDTVPITPPSSPPTESSPPTP